MIYFAQIIWFILFLILIFIISNIIILSNANNNKLSNVNNKLSNVNNKLSNVNNKLSNANIKNTFGGNSSNKHSSHSNKQPLRSESDLYASESDLYAMRPTSMVMTYASDSDVYASDSDVYASESDVYASESNLYAVSMTYTISGEGNGLNYSILRQMLKGNGITSSNGITFVEKPLTDKVHISFGSYGGFANKKSNALNLNPEFYKQHASIKNVLDGHSGFINKTELYETIRRLIPAGIKYIPLTYTIKEFAQNTPCKIKFPAILKKNFSCRQQGVKVIESMEDYYKAKKELDIKEDGAISEYIANCLTIDGKKFHLRVYFLLSVISGITRCTAHNEYRIRTAKDKYKHGDWLNPDIHISGGHTTDTRYKFPDDLVKLENINQELLLKKLNPFLSAMCLALASSGVKNYPESSAGYQLYGADVLITTDLDFYLIEINKHPGFNKYGQNDGWEEYINKFSIHFFYFILSSVVFPYFGLCRIHPPMAEFIGNGTLSPFGEILTGANKCTLIPLFTDLQEDAISTAKKMNFYNVISYDLILSECDIHNIFLIQSKDIIIGFIAINLDSYIKIAIIEEYQNRGIATAMIAQLMEIQYARYYTASHIPIVKIKKKNDFLANIATKLHFTYNKSKKEFERKCKINDPILKKINNNEILTYKIINDDATANNATANNATANNATANNATANNATANNTSIKDHFISLPHMTPSNSQFVHLLYNIFTNTDNIQSKLKNSTGNRYHKTFIYQGAELKSSLFTKTLASMNIFKTYIYKTLHLDTNIFNTNIFNNISNPNKLHLDSTISNKLYFVAYDNIPSKIMNGQELQNSKKLQNSKIDYIEEYYPPFLLKDKLFLLRFRILIYISGNNTVKYFVFDEKKVIFSENEIGEYLTDFDKSNTYKFPNDFTKGELFEIATDVTILDNFMKEFVQVLNKIEYDLLKPYSESNSGFLTITIDVKFVKKNSKYCPILHNIWNFSIINQRQVHNIQHYYHWVQNCVINPHFGFHCHDIINSSIRPILCHVRSPISPNISSKIICELLLQFNKERDRVDILYSVDNKLSKIGTITLNLTNIAMGVIELTSIHLDGKKLDSIEFNQIRLNGIFLLLDILGAYYAPNNPQFIFSNLYAMCKEELEFIAFELKFSKVTKDYFTRKCRDV